MNQDAIFDKADDESSHASASRSLTFSQYFQNNRNQRFSQYNNLYSSFGISESKIQEDSSFEITFTPEERSFSPTFLELSSS